MVEGLSPLNNHPPIQGLCDAENRLDDKRSSKEALVSQKSTRPLRDRTQPFSIYEFLQAISEFAALLSNNSYNALQQERSHIGTYVALSGSLQNNKYFQAWTSLATGVVSGLLTSALTPIAKNYLEAGQTMHWLAAQTASVGASTLNTAAPYFFESGNTRLEAKRAMTDHEIRFVSQVLSKTENNQEKLLDTAMRVLNAIMASKSVKG